MDLKYKISYWIHSVYGVCRINWCTAIIVYWVFTNIQSSSAKAVLKIAWDEIKKAGEKERKLADIDVDSYFQKRKKFQKCVQVDWTLIMLIMAEYHYQKHYHQKKSKNETLLHRCDKKKRCNTFKC